MIIYYLDYNIYAYEEIKYNNIEELKDKLEDKNLDIKTFPQIFVQNNKRSNYIFEIR